MKSDNDKKAKAPAREVHAGEFNLIQNFHTGYRAREDITTLPPGVLVTGSQNVLTNQYQRIGIRRGYTLDGQRDATAVVDSAPIESAFDWDRHTGDTRHMRSGFNGTGTNGKMQYRYVASAGDYYNGTTFTAGQVYWIDLIEDLTSSLFRYGDYWDNEQLLSELLMVNGTSKIWEWTGGVTTLASTSNAAGSISTFNQPGEITAIVGAPTFAGGGYVVGDILNIVPTNSSRSAVVSVTAIGGGGAITTVQLVSGGGGYVVGAGQATSVGGGSNASGATIEVSTVVGVAGTGYAVGDIITATTGGTGATFKVLEIGAAGGAVTLQLLTPGTGYAAGVSATTTSGLGINCTINISAVATGWIQKNGTTSWAEEGFYNLMSPRAVTINGTSYAYTGGETTTYLVGISANPTAEPVNSVIHQTPTITYNYQIRGLPTEFSNDLISVLNNQVYIGSNTERDVYVSAVDNYKDYSYSTPREVSEGAILTLDGSPTAFQPQQNAMYIAAGKDYFFQTQFQLSADNTAESLTVIPLKTTDLQAAQSQELSCKIKNNIAFVSFENMINSLGTQENFLNDPQTQDLSYSIVDDVKDYDFTDGSIKYYANKGKYIAVTLPREGLMLFYNMTDPKNFYWEAPQLMPMQCLSVIDGELYGHSSQASNTFKLFTGTNDDGNAIQAVAKFSFWNQGNRFAYKSSMKWFVEGYMSTNTALTGSLQREVNGSPSSWTWYGTDSRIMFNSVSDGSLGKLSLGKASLGGDTTPVSTFGSLPKFRLKQPFNRVDYFEEQPSFSSNGKDQQWEIVAFGTDATPSVNETNSITL
jgi:hypothetical protein